MTRPRRGGWWSSSTPRCCRAARHERLRPIEEPTGPDSRNQRAESTEDRPMRRTLLGIALLLHGLAHANAGMLAADDGSVVATMLWATASIGFVTAGLG